MKRIVNITIIKKIGKLEKNWKVKKGLEKGLKARNREKEPGGWGLGIGKKVGGWGLILIISNWRFFIVDGNVWNLKKFCTFFKLLSTAPGPFHPPTTGGRLSRPGPLNPRPGSRPGEFFLLTFIISTNFIDEFEQFLYFFSFYYFPNFLHFLFLTILNVFQRWICFLINMKYFSFTWKCLFNLAFFIFIEFQRWICFFDYYHFQRFSANFVLNLKRNWGLGEVRPQSPYFPISSPQP